MAIVAAGCILLAHLISLRHETTVAHVRDTAGILEHAHALAEYHSASTTPHLHGNESEDHADIGPCALLVGLEQSTILSAPPVVVDSVGAVELASAVTPPASIASLSVLAFAPKTSPPMA